MSNTVCNALIVSGPSKQLIKIDHHLKQSINNGGPNSRSRNSEPRCGAQREGDCVRAHGNSVLAVQNSVPANLGEYSSDPLSGRSGEDLSARFESSDIVPLHFLRSFSVLYPECRFDLSSVETVNSYHVETTFKDGCSLILESWQENPYEEFEEELEKSLEKMKDILSPVDPVFLAMEEETGLLHLDNMRPEFAIRDLSHGLNAGIGRLEEDDPDLATKFENLAGAIRKAHSFGCPMEEALLNLAIDCLKKSIGIRFEGTTKESLVCLYRDYVSIASLQEKRGLNDQSDLCKELSEKIWERLSFHLSTRNCEES